MPITILLLQLAGYGVAAWIATVILRRWRERLGENYANRWAPLAAGSLAWLVALAAVAGNGIRQVVLMTLRSPIEDLWALKSINLIGAGLLAAPLVIVAATACVSPFGPWWRSTIVAAWFLIASVTLASLHFASRSNCTVQIRDQFGQPVPDATIDYYLDGRCRGRANRNGDVRIGFYRQLQRRLAIVDAARGGYEIDYRRASGSRNRAIPDTIHLPAWKIVRAPKLLLSRTHIRLDSESRSYAFNLLREQAGEAPQPITDLLIRVDAPNRSTLPQPSTPTGGRFEWRVTIQCADGGIQPAPESYAYLAPSDDFQESYSWTARPDSPDWNPSFNKIFYLKFRNGRAYACARIVVTSLHDPQAGIFVDATINPAADRSLFSGHGMQSHSQSETAGWLRALYGDIY